LGFLATAETTAGHEGAATISRQSSAPEDSSSPGKPIKETSVITFRDGRLTVRVQERSLEWILEEISRVTRVGIFLADGMEDKRISIDFQDLSLDEGLRRLLTDNDAFFFYGGEGKASAAMKAIWVYPKGQGRGLEPVPPEAWASTKEIEGKLAYPDAAVRAGTIETLVERKGDQALDAVLQALKDKEDEVRTRALYAAVDSGMELPADSLIYLALHDQSPNVRFLALEALEGHPKGKEIAERALADPDPHVRNKAQEILRGPWLPETRSRKSRQGPAP